MWEDWSGRWWFLYISPSQWQAYFHLTRSGLLVHTRDSATLLKVDPIYRCAPADVGEYELFPGAQAASVANNYSGYIDFKGVILSMRDPEKAIVFEVTELPPEESAPEQVTAAGGPGVAPGTYQSEFTFLEDVSSGVITQETREVRCHLRTLTNDRAELGQIRLPTNEIQIGFEIRGVYYVQQQVVRFYQTMDPAVEKALRGGFSRNLNAVVPVRILLTNQARAMLGRYQVKKDKRDGVPED